MSKTVSILLGAALSVLLLVIAAMTGLISLNIGSNAPEKFLNKGKLEVICEVNVNKPSDGLNQPFETSKLTLPAIFEFDESTGAYAGEYAISLNRKGTLRVNGEVLEISRPAMFKRYGLVITGEHITLNRRTGEFKQWLDLEAGKRLELIAGRCKRTDNAPF